MKRKTDAIKFTPAADFIDSLAAGTIDFGAIFLNKKGVKEVHAALTHQNS